MSEIQENQDIQFPKRKISVKKMFFIATMVVLTFTAAYIGVVTFFGPKTVTFDTVGGSKIAAVEVTHGKTIAAPTVPTRIEGKDQFKFLGWMTEDGTIWNFEEMPVRKDMTLIAQWEWIPHEEQTGLMLATPLVTRKVAAL